LFEESHNGKLRPKAEKGRASGDDPPKEKLLSLAHNSRKIWDSCLARFAVGSHRAFPFHTSRSRAPFVFGKRRWTSIIATFRLLGKKPTTGILLRKIRLHGIRHTYLLLSNGESPVLVKEQLDHSSITITVDIYRRLIPPSNRQAVNRLEAQLSATQTPTPQTQRAQLIEIAP
jgi:integrase